MKKRLILSLVVGLVLVSMLALTGCHKSSSDPDPLDVNGTWTIVAIGYPTMIASLTYTNTTITGTVADSDSYSTGISGSTTAPAGSTEPRTITLVITFNDGQIATLSGTVSDNNTSMSGSYLDNFGGSDTWTATKQ